MADLDAAVIAPGPSVGPLRGDLHHRAAAARSQAAATRNRARELWRQTACVLAESSAIRQAITEAGPDWQPPAARLEAPERPAHARIMAWSQTMPVIEQAKGIIMAQSRCGEAEAFEILRRVSQESNVPVRKLAARIVAQAPS